MILLWTARICGYVALALILDRMLNSLILSRTTPRGVLIVCTAVPSCDSKLWAQFVQLMSVKVSPDSFKDGCVLEPAGIRRSIDFSPWCVFFWPVWMHVAAGFPASNPCDGNSGRGPCSHLCLIDYNRTASCSCPHLMKISPGNRSCVGEWRPHTPLQLAGTQSLCDTIAKEGVWGVTRVIKVYVFAILKHKGTTDL